MYSRVEEDCFYKVVSPEGMACIVVHRRSRKDWDRVDHSNGNYVSVLIILNHFVDFLCPNHTFVLLENMVRLFDVWRRKMDGYD